ncbi:MAG: hypothetical protein KatS3mg036_0521 [Ignavibacterium sp.]|jgi:hypothetical protein|uniref:hypothetical protein n=1 Tax=Ignavibacterium sp. TaxID=2651167 RepID=UPI0021DBB6D3|nr:hypothetical protein [Ignavibacterium sp.]BDQ02168.1 MAG: hypothetical protein KatS3mg037_0743 [Ignavibacterium sp.]GIV45703.1 MAG: hypothetical protein KatS3mg036_0521 [Ignavibacterium sp.]
MRTFLALILTLFLFAGILGSANEFFIFAGEKKGLLSAKLSNEEIRKPSIKEIEDLSSKNNLRFTIYNSLKFGKPEQR